MLASVRIRGQEVQCADLEAVVMHGRASATDGPTASSASIIVYSWTMPLWTVGDELEVFSHWPPERRFRGVITDLNLTGHHERLGAMFQIDATGDLAVLGRRYIGDVPWPVESPAARASRILQAAAVQYMVADKSGLRVNARDVDRRSALELITELAEDTGAAVFDDPDGVIHFQHYSTRAETWRFTRWMDLPDDLDWTDWGTGWGDMGATWDSTEITSSAAPTVLKIDGNVVLWEPGWTSTSGEIVNSVTVDYGPDPEEGDRPSVTLTREDSITRYGRQHTDGPGNLANAASARERAAMMLDLHAMPQWALSSVLVLLDKVQSPLRFLNIRCGQRVQITCIPQPAPEIEPVMIVEGWTHTMAADGNVLELQLSHPAHSYAGISWAALPTQPRPARWIDVDPAVIWVDVITVDDVILIP